MSPHKPSREFECILFGASGFTGSLTAAFISEFAPKDFRWAVAGREGSKAKLAKLVADLRTRFPDRPSPAIVTIGVYEYPKGDLERVVQRTDLVLNTAGPFQHFGEPVLKACVFSGIDYIDCTGEAHWVADMIKKYDAEAKRFRAIIIPQCGVDSVPSDLMVWSLANLMQKKFSTGLGNVTGYLRDITGVPSGGTCATAMASFEKDCHEKFKKAVIPFALSPVSRATNDIYLPVDNQLTKYTGVRKHEELGFGIPFPLCQVNSSLVGRSWGILDRGSFYGSKFRYEEFLSIPSLFPGLIMHFISTLAPFFLNVWLIRQLISLVIPKPGTGAKAEKSQHHKISYRIFDDGVPNPNLEQTRRGTASFEYQGDLYYLTGALMASAAFVLLRGDGNTFAQKQGGGLLTPATLGSQLVDWCHKFGAKIDANVITQ